MALTKIDDRGLKTPIDLLDNEKIRFGTGNDLEIYHNGSASYIQDNGAGDLIIRASDQLKIQETDNGETMAIFNKDGAVELYHNNSKKFETTTGGAKAVGNLLFTGNMAADDNCKVMLGSSDDIQIYHDANHSYIDNHTGSLKIRNAAAGNILIEPRDAEASIIAKPDNAVELYYDNSIKLNTNGGGVKVHGHIYADDNDKILLGDNTDLQIYHDGSNSYIADEGTGDIIISSGTITFKNQARNETHANFIGNGACELYHNNSKKISTASFGVQMEEDVQFPSPGDTNALTWDKSEYTLEFRDNVKAAWGDGDDLQIFHNGSQSYIDNTGTLNLRSTGNIELLKNGGDEPMAKFTPDGAVELYYNNTKRFDTNNGGAACHGAFTVHGELGIDNGGDNNKYMDVRLGSSTFALRGTSGGDANHETMANFARNGNCELFYDNSKKFETTSSGATVNGTLVCSALNAPSLVANMATNGYNIQVGDSNSGVAFRNRIKIGDGDDLQLYHDGSNSYIADTGTGVLAITGSQIDLYNAASNETMVQAYQNGAVKLRYDNSIKLETTSSGATITGTLLAATSDTPGYKQTNSSYGSQIWIGGWDSGTNSAGICRVRSSNDNLHIDSGANGELYLQSYSSGKVRLGSPIYEHTDEARIQLRNSSYNSYLYIGGWTTSNSANISRIRTSNDNLHIDSGANGNIYLNNYAGTATYTASVAPKTDNTYNLGSSSQRWANVYTYDLNLSNEGSQNDVDGTWGSWTIQEGQDDLFLLNKRNGKKYKFNLTEVS